MSYLKELHDKVEKNKSSFYKLLLKSTIYEIFEYWVRSEEPLNGKSALRNYHRYTIELFSKGIIPYSEKLSDLEKFYKPFQDKLSINGNLNQMQKYTRCVAFVAFTSFIEKKTQGIIKKFKIPAIFKIPRGKSKPLPTH